MAICALVIRDGGPGITPEDCGKIFEPFTDHPMSPHVRTGLRPHHRQTFGGIASGTTLGGEHRRKGKLLLFTVPIWAPLNPSSLSAAMQLLGQAREIAWDALGQARRA